MGALDEMEDASQGKKIGKIMQPAGVESAYNNVK